MRFVWAVLAFVLATLLIGAGIAQRTVFLGPKTQQTPLSVEQASPYTLVDGAVLRTQAGAQTLLVRGEGEIFAAYGRTPDLQAWLADAAYNAISVNDDGEIVVDAVAPVIVPEPEEGTDESAEEGTDESSEEDAEDGAEEGADESAEETAEEGEGAEEADSEETPQPGKPERNPAGSDLWLDEFTDEDALIADMQLPEGMSVLIARDGVEDAPTDIAVAWPLDNSTPWAGPLMIAGGALMLLGIILYVMAIRYQRRGRGPRRKGPGPLPPTEPLDMALVRGEDRAAITGGGAGAPETDEDKSAEKDQTPRRRLRFVIPALGLSAAMMAGCSADSWPQLTAPSPTPSPTQTVIAPENQQAPAITDSQAARILQRLAAIIAEADEEGDADLLATRMSGTPLEERKTDYKLREEIEDRDPPAPIPTDEIEILLPQAYDGWPRTVMILSRDAQEEDAEEIDPPVVFTMVQESPWEPYKLNYLAGTQPAAQLPELAPAWLGTQLIPPDSPFLAMAPEDIAEAFADVIDKGEESEHYEMFDEAAWNFGEVIRDSRETVVQGLADADAADTSQAEFSTKLTEGLPVSLGTLDSGAIVAIDLLDTQKVTPTVDDAVIRYEENEEAEALTGATEASKGVETDYSIQLFFSVPSQGSAEPIKLLAAHHVILDVKVIE